MVVIEMVFHRCIKLCDIFFPGGVGLDYLFFSVVMDGVVVIELPIQNYQLFSFLHLFSN